MAIYELKRDGLRPLPGLTFSEAGISDGTNIRRFLPDYIEMVAPGTLVVAPDYCRLDTHNQVVLGIDKAADLVLVEFRKDQVLARMELRALRLATMASSLSFARVAALYGDYLSSTGDRTDPVCGLLDFLGWQEPDDQQFGQDVRIVLASAKFSRDVAAAVIWLNEHGLDIRCVRLEPFLSSGRVLLDCRQILPVPEAADLRDVLKDRETAARVGDLRKYNVKLGAVEHEKLATRWAIWHVIKQLVDAGVSPCLSQVVLKSSAMVS